MIHKTCPRGRKDMTEILLPIMQEKKEREKGGKLVGSCEEGLHTHIYIYIYIYICIYVYILPTYSLGAQSNSADVIRCTTCWNLKEV